MYVLSGFGFEIRMSERLRFFDVEAFTVINRIQ